MNSFESLRVGGDVYLNDPWRANSPEREAEHRYNKKVNARGVIWRYGGVGPSAWPRMTLTAADADGDSTFRS